MAGASSYRTTTANKIDRIAIPRCDNHTHSSTLLVISPLFAYSSAALVGRKRSPGISKNVEGGFSLFLIIAQKK